MTSICRHIRTNGERCGSPALRQHVYCYYHRSLHRRHPSVPEETAPAIIHLLNPGHSPTQVASPTTPRLSLPALEDRESIQVALSVIIGSLARNELDAKRASTLLYGLQVASANAVKLNHRPSLNYVVTETTTDPTGQELAPDEDPLGETSYQQFLKNFEEEEEDD